MKLWKTIIIVTLVLAVSCGCGLAKTYTASADGFGGPVTVTVEIEDGKLINVVAEGTNETQGIGSNAIEQLPSRILEAQSAEIDGVSGCTFSSNAVLSAARAAIAQAEDSAAQTYVPGTYTKSAKGRNAAVTVEVVLSEDRIEAVKVTSHDETQAVASVALERIPSMIVEYQTTKIDAVTGATVTTNAIKSAVNAAIEEAGGNPAILPECYAVPGEPIEASADIVVVGGGGAGMAAAISAMQNGASVILIEKTSMLGGNTVLCGGSLNAADTEWAAQYDAQEGEDTTLQKLAETDESTIAPEYLDDFHTLQTQIAEYLASGSHAHFDSVELHTIQSYIYGKRQSLTGETIYGDYDLVSTLTRNAMGTVEWLQSLGIEWTDTLGQPTGAMWRRGHVPPLTHGEDYVLELEQRLKEMGATLMFETSGKELITDESGRVVGVKAECSNGTSVTLYAEKAVILATGGYAHNLAMVQETNEYWPVISDEIGTTNASGMTGDGIVMAQAVGADTVGMGFVQMMPIADPVTGDLFTGILTQSTANYLFVNSEGKRFVNECEARDTLAKAAIENGGIFYMISDLPMAKTARVTNWETEVERGNAIMADTLEELGAELGFDEAGTQNLIASVAQHNKAVETGIDPEFGKNTFELKIEEAPFLATPRKPSLHHTMGGLRIDTQAHVLDQQGNIIPGLYAAGEVTGGIHGGNRLGGNAVADCFTFGKIAGETACGD